MATNLEDALDSIAEGLQEQAQESLTRQGAVDTGALRKSVRVNVRNDDFTVNFLDYGVFVDQGTSNVKARPFYSDLVEEGPQQGTAEEEIEQMLEEAFDDDVEELDNEFNDLINE